MEPRKESEQSLIRKRAIFLPGRHFLLRFNSGDVGKPRVPMERVLFTTALSVPFATCMRAIELSQLLEHGDVIKNLKLGIPTVPAVISQLVYKIIRSSK